MAEDQKININDSERIKIATDEVSEKFSGKMKSIGVSEKEREAQAKALLGH